MAVVVDTCCVHDVFRQRKYPILLDWLMCIRCRLALCPQLTRQYKDAGMLEIVAEFERQGRLVARSGGDLKREMEKTEMRQCVSDDQETIALMRLTGVRVICTSDNDLRRDIKNSSLLKPPGKLYPKREADAARELLRRYGRNGDR